MDSQAIQIWDSLNIRSRLVLQLSHVVLFYSLEGKFFPFIIYIDILRYYYVTFTVVTLIVHHVCLRARNPLNRCVYPHIK